MDVPIRRREGYARDLPQKKSGKVSIWLLFYLQSNKVVKIKYKAVSVISLGSSY